MMNISNQLDETILRINEVLKDCQDIVHRKLYIAGVGTYLVYVDSMIDRELIEGDFLRDLMYGIKKLPEYKMLAFLQTNALTTADSKLSPNLKTL